MNWMEFKKTFTQHQEDVLWQYFIDHSKIQPNGYYGIMFYVRNINDFWKRVYARSTNNFKRYDVIEKQGAMQRITAMSRVRKRMSKKSVWYDRIIMKLVSILRSYLIKRYGQ